MYAGCIATFFRILTNNSYLPSHTKQNNIELYIRTYTLLSKINCNIYSIMMISKISTVCIYFICFV
jgi:hypothetical protein